MSRNLDSTFAAALEAGVVRLVVFMYAEFNSGPLYLCTADHDITVGGHTYSGIASLVGIDRIDETGDVQSTGIKVSLNGLDPAILEIVEAEVAQDQVGTISLGLVDSSGNLIGSGPYVAFSGLLDIASSVDDPRAAAISINYESKLADLERPRAWRWTDQDQKIAYPNDRGFEFVGPLADQEIAWGFTFTS